MIIKIHSQGIEHKQLEEICNCLENGGVIIYPTDTLYAFACKLGNLKASEKLAGLKGKKFEKSCFSIVCKDISQASEFTKPINNNNFKILKYNTPGEFTFILEASTKIPKILQNKRKTIGIRIPNNNTAISIVDFLGYPIITSSLNTDNEEKEYYNHPEIIEEVYGNRVDIVIDQGIGNNYKSTVIDLTCENPEIIRQGFGKLIY